MSSSSSGTRDCSAGGGGGAAGKPSEKGLFALFAKNFQAATTAAPGKKQKAKTTDAAGATVKPASAAAAAAASAKGKAAAPVGGPTTPPAKPFSLVKDPKALAALAPVAKLLATPAAKAVLPGALATEAAISAASAPSSAPVAAAAATASATSSSVPPVAAAAHLSAPVVRPGITIEEVPLLDTDEFAEDESKKPVGERRDDPLCPHSVEVDYSIMEATFPGYRTHQPTAATDDVSFQMWDIDYYMDPVVGAAKLAPTVPQPYPRLTHEAPVFRLYSRAMSGASSCTHVHNFLPYLYIMCDEDGDDEATLGLPGMLEQFEEALEQEIAACQYGKMFMKQRDEENASEKQRASAARVRNAVPKKFLGWDDLDDDEGLEPEPSQPGRLARPSSRSEINRPGRMSRAASGVSQPGLEGDGGDDDMGAGDLCDSEEGYGEEPEDDEDFERDAALTRDADRFLTSEEREEQIELGLEGIAIVDSGSGSEDDGDGDERKADNDGDGDAAMKTSGAESESSSSGSDSDSSRGGKRKCKGKRKLTDAEKAKKYHKKHQRCIESVRVTAKRSLMFYRIKDSKAWKITLTNPLFMAAARRVLSEKGLELRVPKRGKVTFFFSVFECNIAFELRFMVNTKVMGPAWLTLQKGTYLSRSDDRNAVRPKASRCDWEFDVSYDRIKVETHTDPKWAVISPVRILSLDIESLALAKRFATAAKGDPAITIGCATYVHGHCSLEAGKEYLHGVTFQLGSTMIAPGKQIIPCRSVREVYYRLFQYIIDIDADLITGWNIGIFDIPEIADGAEYFYVPEFADIGRILAEKAVVEDSRFESKAHGKRQSKRLIAHGRIMMDMLPEYRKENKRRFYGLGAVSEAETGQTKLDLDYELIPVYQSKDAFHRRLIAVYCLNDAVLVLMIMIKLKIFINLVEMARAAGVPIAFLLYRGQQVKVVSLILRFIFRTTYIFPFHKVDRSNMEKYIGALVLLAKKGYYTVPIATLDFASLYPSIMILHNMCYATLLHPFYHEKLHLLELKPEDVEFSMVTGKREAFVRSGKQQGILPQILVGLLAARGEAKKLMKKAAAAGDESEELILNGRQLALKISANSYVRCVGDVVFAVPANVSHR
jgi:DNA polymerase elongation subunit (family B)